MKQRIGRLLSTLLLTTFSLGITAGVIKGTIIDKQTKEPLTGATVQVTGSATGAVADLHPYTEQRHLYPRSEIHRIQNVPDE